MSTRRRSSRRRHEGAGAPGAEHRAGARTPAGLIVKAYGRFLELPVVVLWLLGALILSAVVLGIYAAVVCQSVARAAP